MNQLTISDKIETCFSIKKLVNLIEAQILELNENLELTSEEIFEIVCQESHLNTDLLKQALGCKCPFALIGFINELEFNEFSKLIEKELNCKCPFALTGFLKELANSEMADPVRLLRHMKNINILALLESGLVSSQIAAISKQR